MTQAQVKGWYWKDRKSSFGGYAGVYHTANKIKEMIPKSRIYVEPFAGLGRTSEDKHGFVVLNDMSDYANEQNKKNHPYALITKEDFVDCILAWDSKNTFFLIDPPWFDREYKSNSLSYCNMRANVYYECLKQLLPELKGDWIILSKAHKPQTEKWDYPQILVESDKNVLFGKKAKTLLTLRRNYN